MNNKHPLISVITPSYNHQDYVQQTISSILEQDYPNLEYIIINDGSKDETGARIVELEPKCREKLSNFVYISNNNKGVSATLNQAISLAKGEFVFLIASDDIASDKSAISKLYETSLKHPDSVFFCGDAKIINQHGQRIYWDKRQKSYSEQGKNHYGNFVKFFLRNRKNFDLAKDFGSYESFLQGNYIPVGLMIKKSIFNEVGLFNEELALEDIDMWLRISKSFKMTFLNETLVSYRWHENNNVKKLNHRLVKDYIYILQREKEYCLNNGLKKQWQKSLIRLIQNLIFRMRFKLLFSEIKKDNYHLVFLSFLTLWIRLIKELIN